MLNDRIDTMALQDAAADLRGLGAALAAGIVMR
jgi:hypothetical protein